MSPTVWITEPGMYPDLTPDQYFEDPCPRPSLNASTIKVMRETSVRHAAFRHPRLNPYRQDSSSSKALFLGSAVHRLALGKGREVSVIRYPDFKTSSARRARDAAVANGRIPVLEKQHVEALEMAEIVRDAIERRLGGREYMTEVPVFWTRETEAGRIWCRIMLDVWCPSLGLALDVKTTRGQATEEWVARDVADNRYDVPDTWYLEGLANVLPDMAGRLAFEFLYIETSEPYGTRPYELGALTRELAEYECDRAAEAWGAALASWTFPSYPTTPGRIEAAGWHLRRLTERRELESVG